MVYFVLKEDYKIRYCHTKLNFQFYLTKNSSLVRAIIFDCQKTFTFWIKGQPK